MKCPYCESEDCKKVSLVYESGTSAGSFTGVGAGVGGSSGGLGAGGAAFGGKTSTQTLLARRLAPPPDPQNVGAMAVFAGFIAILALIYSVSGDSVSSFGLGVAAVLGVLAIGAGISYAGQKKGYPQKLARWQGSWICLRCGKDWWEDEKRVTSLSIR